MNQSMNTKRYVPRQPPPHAAPVPYADELRRAHVLTVVQKDIIELAAGGASIDALLNALVLAAQGLTEKGARAAVFIVDPEGARLRFSAAAGLPEAYTRAVDGFVIGPTSPSCGKAAYTGQAVIVRDVAQDPLWAPHLHLAQAHGIRACWSFPLHSATGKLLGTFALYHRVPREPEPRDLEAVRFLAHTAAIVIERHRLAEERRLERDQVDAALLRRAARFETMLSDAPLGVYVIDADLRFQHANPTALSAFASIPDLIGRDFAEVVHIVWPGAYADEIVRLFRRTLETGMSHAVSERGEERWDRGPTEYYEWQINRTPLHDGRYGVVCYFRDITSQVKARLATLASEEALKEADQHKNTFLVTLAHELRSPLATLRSGLDIMKLRRNDAEVRGKFLPIMERQLGQMTRLIEDVVDVSRISMGKIELRKERAELVSAVNDAVEAIRLRCDNKDQDLTITGPQQPIFLNVDPTRLAQMLGNLLNNASKFTGHGGAIQLVVEIESAHAVVRVRDTGIGIAADQFDRIFEMFTQLDRSRGRTQGGLGIGLALVKTLAEAHGGSVEVQSAGPGLGSEFFLRLPMAAEPPAA